MGSQIFARAVSKFFRSYMLAGIILRRIDNNNGKIAGDDIKAVENPFQVNYIEK
jgi:hypothetical protein